MSLAARCPACGTVFRVVQDQLRISEGWVRCGRCSEVFNAVEHFVDIDADSAVTTKSPSATAPSAMVDVDVGAWHDEAQNPPPEAVADPEPALAQAVALAVQRSLREASEATAPPAAPAPALAATPPGAGTSGRTEPAFDLDEPSRFDAAANPPPHPSGPAAAEPQQVAEPRFVRQAKRAARWRHPAVRAGLVLTGLLLISSLGAQIGLTYRDALAARSPLLQPAIEALCQWQGCKIEPPRQIEALSVDSSGLVRVEGTAMYRLNVVLRNRSPQQLALPWLDLTLTDTQGAVIARRVVSPQALGVQRPSMPSLGELPIQATLAAADKPISGYTIEIFYP